MGIEADEDRLKLFFAEVSGKDLAELIAAGREKLATVPSGGGGVAAAAAPGAGGGAAAAAEAPKEEKVEEKEESDDVRSIQPFPKFCLDHLAKQTDIKPFTFFCCRIWVSVSSIKWEEIVLYRKSSFIKCSASFVYYLEMS